MPPGIENNRADWKKIVTAVQDSFTVRRAAWKKAVSHPIVNRGASTDTVMQLKNSVKMKSNIYDLAATLIKKSNCIITVELCARRHILG
jgi:hypothetical protein